MSLCYAKSDKPAFAQLPQDTVQVNRTPPEQAEDAGVAALGTCEALLLAVSDHDLLRENAVVGVLRDPVASHENAAGSDF